MNPDHILDFLTEVGRHDRLTQREIAARLNISLGLTNTILHKNIDQGLISMNGSSQYQLTPMGHEEKSRLMYHRMKNTIDWYKATRQRVHENLQSLDQSGVNRIVFYGAGDVAEVTYGVLDRVVLELVAVVDDFRPGEAFYEWSVKRTSELSKIKYDRIVVTTFRSAKAIHEQILELGIPESHLFFFH